jgi:hypothetical protein
MPRTFLKELSSCEAQLTADHIPNRLHHYTSLKSLIGIVDRKEIWFTNIEYLNDITEFKEGKEIFLRILGSARENFRHAASFAAIREYVHDAITPYDLFSFSASEKSDSLEQWRAYANAESGVMITFQGIFRQLAHVGISCMKVVYDERGYTGYARGLVERMTRWDLSHPELNQDHFWGQLHSVLAKLFLKKKNSAFQHEDEWKLFYSHREQNREGKNGYEVVKEDIRFRAAENYIIPYSILDLTRIEAFDRQSFVHEVLVSPTIKQKEKGQSRSIEGIKRLLAKNDIERYEKIVKFSLLPYR